MISNIPLESEETLLGAELGENIPYRCGQRDRRKCFQMRVKMIRCLGEEPEGPADPGELEQWCAVGNSGQPIQTHVGDEGTILWVNDDSSVCVEFDDGDQRLMFPDEVELAGLSNGHIF